MNLLEFTLFKKRVTEDGPTDGPTHGPTDGPTHGRTKSLIELLFATKNDNISIVDGKFHEDSITGI